MCMRTACVAILTICCCKLSIVEGSGLPSTYDVVSQQNLSIDIEFFAFDLLKQLAVPHENLVFSPVSVYAGLSLLHLGATGNSWNELSTVMKLPASENQSSKMHKNLGHMFSSIVSNEAFDSEITVANGLFLQKDFIIKDEYLQESKACYNASLVDRVDFQKAEELARNTINQWISSATNGRIPEVCNQPFDPSTELVLANALFFKARWETVFDSTETKVDKFHAGSLEIDVQMMTNTGYVRYHKNPTMEFEVLELPYLNNNLSIYFLLPYGNQNLTNLTKLLDPAKLEKIRNQLKETAVEYSIPRFKFSSSQSLNTALKQLGLKTLFLTAQLGNLTVAKNLRLSDVKHTANIELKEEGTTGSAATIVVLEGRAAHFKPLFKDVVKMKFNRPFSFAVSHRPLRIPLFTGIVSKPTPA